MQRITKHDVLDAGSQLDTVCEQYGLKDNELQIIFLNMMVLTLYQVQRHKGPFYDAMRELLTNIQTLPMVGLMVEEERV